MPGSKYQIIAGHTDEQGRLHIPLRAVSGGKAGESRGESADGDWCHQPRPNLTKRNDTETPLGASRNDEYYSCPVRIPDKQPGQASIDGGGSRLIRAIVVLLQATHAAKVVRISGVKGSF